MSITNPTPVDIGDELCAAELDAWRGLLRVHACVLKAVDAELEATHRLPLTSYEVLVQLSSTPDHRMRMCDLADSVSLSRSGMSRLVDRLERDGLIARAACTADARGAFAVLTDAGRELLEAARPTYRAGIRRRFLGRCSEDELRQLAELWERVLPGLSAGR